MNENIDSPQPYAHVAGVLYLIIIAAGVFADAYVQNALIEPNAAATASNILAHPTLFRAGIAADLSTYLSAIVVTVILYALLQSVNSTLALMMLLFNLAQDAIGGMNALNAYRSLQLLGRASYLASFTPEQRQALVMLTLRGHDIGFAVAMMFFGVSCLILGYLIFYSRFLPRFLGVLMAVAGLCYVVNSSAELLWPSFASIVLLLPAFVGELLLAGWLTVKGVDLARWNEVARET